MVRFDDLALFVRTAALGSFSSAAREADLLPGQASAAVARLERALDLRLFARSTRSLRLTAEGEQYLPYARQVLELLRDGREHVRGADSALHGVLQVTAPSDLGRNVLLPWLTEFRAAHPKLTLRLHLSDQVADLYRAPVDVAFRLGRIDDADHVALPVAADNRRVLVAAPAYPQRHGRPATLDALREHACLLYVLAGRAYDRWQFDLDGRRHVVPVRGAMLCDDADVVRRWAVAGEGIAYKSWLDVCADVQAGRLEVLLPECGDRLPLQLVCPHRKQFSPAIRQLHALFAQRCQALTALYPLQADAVDAE
ncbi:LysR family transcriptional regulator [Xanthomonas campestris pv. passiflorae]|uniref:LysR family transcriptional regulator n=1 Tax=Xanthomonas campestris TaxID=339 RepID=UPI002420D0E8|nr:LysR family transcriptional regulator [Xanthomonas campestris]MBV6814648.1 LysR family transcriptional regulator [Xanthomonas campestris pv. passiflorae]